MLLFPSLESQTEDKDREREEEDDVGTGECSKHVACNGRVKAGRWEEVAGQHGGMGFIDGR